MQSGQWPEMGLSSNVIESKKTSMTSFDLTFPASPASPQIVQTESVRIAQDALSRFTETQFSEALPLMMVGLLERRYLSDLRAAQWDIEAPEGDAAVPMLREITALGRPHAAEEWANAMPHVLTACHDPGHALVMAVHSDGERHRLLLGARRIIGAGGRSTEDYLNSQESAFKAYFTGLQMGAPAKMNPQQMPELADFVQTAPSLALLTGIPSGRGSKLPVDLQSLDRLVKAVGNQRYTLMVVAEPVAPLAIDQSLDACRRIKSAIHAYIRRTKNRSEGGSASVAHTEVPKNAHWMSTLPVGLYGASVFCGVVGLFVPGLSILEKLMQPIGSAAMGIKMAAGNVISEEAKQLSDSTSWTDGGGIELLNANAEACEALLMQHIRRLEQGRSNGWWRMAIYVAGESPAATQSVCGALRSLCSGDTSALDPIRIVQAPDYLIREAAAKGQILSLRPTAGTGHPLGETYDSLTTCVTSEELSVLVNMPQHEIPGLPMHDVSTFALSAPSPSDPAISLGMMQDSMGRDLSPVQLTADEINRHVFVSGITGYGKTNTCMHLLLEAYTKFGTPFLVIEPAKAEYHRLRQLPELQSKLRVYSIGANSPLPLRLNPLAPVPGIPLSRHIDLLKAVFNASFSMFAGMQYVLEEALLDVYAERGWSLYTSENVYLGAHADQDLRMALTPSLSDLHDKIDVVLKRKNYGQEVNQNMGAALRSRLRSLLVSGKGAALDTRRTTPLADLFDSPAVIELQNLGDDEEKAFVMALLFALLYEYAEVRQNDVPENRRGKLQHLTLIEEAHRLLAATHGSHGTDSGDPRGKAVTMFTDMLAEMRAYGEGFIIADQIPTKLAPETLKNSNVKIVHRLASPDDRQAVGACINLNDQQIRHLNTLRKGEAIVHDEMLGEAVLTKIFPFKDNRAPDVSREALDRQTGGAKLQDSSYLWRNAACRFCPAPCTFFHRLEDSARQESAAQRLNSLHPVLESMLYDDAEIAWAFWTRWRTRWQQNSPVLLGTTGLARQGTTFCAVTQTAYVWLGTQQLLRLVSARPELVEPNSRAGGAAAAEELTELTAVQRLQREVGVRLLGELVWPWTQAETLDAKAWELFDTIQPRLHAALWPAPPVERIGCAECPTRCSLLGYTLPAVQRQAVQRDNFVQKLLLPLSPSDRILVLQSLVAQEKQQVALLNKRPNAEVLHRHWLYCFLVNLLDEKELTDWENDSGQDAGLSPKAAAARDEALAWLRRDIGAEKVT